MKRIIFFTIIILLISAIISIFIKISDFNNGQIDEIDKELVAELEDKVMNYLIGKGYREEEIYNLEVKFNPKIGTVPDAYYADVIFKDDKKMTYEYREDENGNIIQGGFSGPDDIGKHLEVVEDESVE